MRIDLDKLRATGYSINIDGSETGATEIIISGQSDCGDLANGMRKHIRDVSGVIRDVIIEEAISSYEKYVLLALFD